MSQVAIRLLDDLEEDFIVCEPYTDALKASKDAVKKQMLALGENKIEHGQIKISCSTSYTEKLKKDKDTDLMAFLAQNKAIDVYDTVQVPNIDRIKAKIAAGELPADTISMFFNETKRDTFRVTKKK